MIEFLSDFGAPLVTVLTVTCSLVASGHAILRKRDTRAAIGWVGLIWLVPLIGALLYFLLGINRIERRAQELRGDLQADSAPTSDRLCRPAELAALLEPDATHLLNLAKLIGDLTSQPLLRGNRVAPLVNGDEAYPAMIEAIEQAERSIALSTYIFASDRAGRMFINALKHAKGRGVEVRVIIDDVGARYTWPPVSSALRRAGIPVVRFLRTLVPGRLPYANLRTHRKLLVVDGRIGFTGGINIRRGHVFAWEPRHPVQDLHFRVDGPAVSHLQEVFVKDWVFSTGEVLRGDAWFPDIEEVGHMPARGISDGPDEDFEKLPMTILGALGCARSSVRVVTPYFLPDASLITALNVAAMRGVEVDILVPARNNLRLVQWASTALMWQMLQRGCRIWLTPPPFDHTKLMLVDDAWTLLGSANWDPRSLRLNFEFNLECYDRDLTSSLEDLVRRKLRSAHRVMLEEVDGRSLPVRLRDGVARLFSPYL